MKKRIKVLQLQIKYYIRDSDLHEEVIKALPVKYFEVTSAYFKGQPQVNEMVSVSEHVKYFNFSSRQMKGMRIQAMWNLWKFCRKEKFDIILTNGFKTLNILLKLNKVLKVPHCIGIIHGFGDFDRLYRRIDAKFYIDKRWSFVGVSSAVSSYLSSLGYGFTQNNVHTINNALDIEASLSTMLSRDEACKKLEVKPDSFVFGTIGRLVSVKGHKYLLEAFKAIHKIYPLSQLIIIGDGKLRNNLQNYINNNNLNTCVKLTGEIFYAFQLIRAFDTFVLSSTKEGFGLVLLEAMIGKVPIISSDTGGVSSVMPQDGILVRPGNSIELQNAMQTMLNLSSTERQAIGENSYTHLLKNFTIEAYRKNYRQLILSKLSKEQKAGIPID